MDQNLAIIGVGLVSVGAIGLLAYMERRRQLAQEARQTAYDEYLKRKEALKAESRRKTTEALSRRETLSRKDHDRAFEVGRATERRTLEARGEEAKTTSRPIGRATGQVRTSELRSTDPYIGGGHDSMSLHHPLNPLNPVHHSSLDDCSTRSSGSSWGGCSSSSYDSGSSSSCDSSSSSSCD